MCKKGIILDEKNVIPSQMHFFLANIMEDPPAQILFLNTLENLFPCTGKLAYLLRLMASTTYEYTSFIKK